MVQYHQQNMKLSQQNKEIEKAIKERAQELNKPTELKEKDAYGALAECVTDHVQTAMEKFITAYTAATNTKTTATFKSNMNL